MAGKGHIVVICNCVHTSRIFLFPGSALLRSDRLLEELQLVLFSVNFLSSEARVASLSPSAEEVP